MDQQVQLNDSDCAMILFTYTNLLPVRINRDIIIYLGTPGYYKAMKGISLVKLNRTYAIRLSTD